MSGMTMSQRTRSMLACWSTRSPSLAEEAVVTRNRRFSSSFFRELHICASSSTISRWGAEARGYCLPAA